MPTYCIQLLTSLQATDEGRKSVVKGKRSSVSTALSRQLKAVKHPGKMSSSIDDKAQRDDSSLLPIKVSSTNQVNVAKRRHRRKMEKPKPMVQQDTKGSENIFGGQHIKSILQNSSLNHKVNGLLFMLNDFD